MESTTLRMGGRRGGGLYVLVLCTTYYYVLLRISTSGSHTWEENKKRVHQTVG